MLLHQSISGKLDVKVSLTRTSVCDHSKMLNLERGEVKQEAGKANKATAGSG